MGDPNNTNELEIKRLIGLTERLIETIIQENMYRQNHQTKAANRVSKIRKDLMCDYDKMKYIALNDNTDEMKKTFPFLFNQLKFLNNKLLTLAVNNIALFENNVNKIDK